MSGLGLPEPSTCRSPDSSTQTKNPTCVLVCPKQNGRWVGVSQKLQVIQGKFLNVLMKSLLLIHPLNKVHSLLTDLRRPKMDSEYYKRLKKLTGALRTRLPCPSHGSLGPEEGASTGTAEQDESESDPAM